MLWQKQNPHLFINFYISLKILFILTMILQSYYHFNWITGICLVHTWHRRSWKLVTLHFWHKKWKCFLCQKHKIPNFWRTGKGKFTKCFRSFGRFNLDLIFRDGKASEQSLLLFPINLPSMERIMKFYEHNLKTCHFSLVILKTSTDSW